MLSMFTYVVSCVRTSLLFIAEFHFIITPHVVYPYICSGPFELFPLCSSYEECHKEHLCTSFYVDPCFHCMGIHPGIELEVLTEI